MNISKKIWSVLSKKYRKMAFIIFILSLLATLLETIGIGLIVPTITILVDENIFSKYPLLLYFSDQLGNPSRTTIVIYGVSLLITVYLVKSFFLAFFAWKQSQYIYGVKADLSHKLFNKYMHFPYEFHLGQNSSHLIRNLTSEINQFTSNVIRSIIVLANEILVVIALIILLFYFEPLGAIIVFLMSATAMLIFQLVTRKRLRKWGEERQIHEGFRIQKAQEGLSGSKDVKLFGKEDNFIKNFNIHNLNTAIIEIKQSTLSQIPRLWLETVGIIGIGLIIIISTVLTNTTKDVIPIIAVFAAAAFRIIPSSNRILGSLQALKYADVVTNLVYNELNKSLPKFKKQDTVVTFNNKIELIDISYTYPNSEKKALSNLFLNIKKGHTVGVVGSSGAGKSTLVDLILGLLEPSSGKILVDDLNINDGMRSWQNLIGYVQQSIFLTDDTLKKNIGFGLDDNQINEEVLRQAIMTSQLDKFIDSLPNGLNTFVGERGVRLSGGQRQRIGIARALYNNPSILVFDEATSALDNTTEKELMKSIYALKGLKTMIIIAHRLSTLEKCDVCYRVINGQIELVKDI